MIIRKVISGGQTGVDIGGLAAAKACNIPTGGLMPCNWQTEEGRHPEYKELYGMEECEGGYTQRTRLNLRMADASIIIAQDWKSPGTVQTLEMCEMYQKPYFRVTMQSPAHMAFLDGQNPNVFADWLVNGAKFARLENVVLNVAGNRESKARGIGNWTQNYLRMAFNILKIIKPM